MAGPLGSTPGIIVGVGVGAAASAALAPAIEIPKQEAWAANANRILDVGLLARLVAQGGVALAAAHGEAKRDGYGQDKLDALVYLSQTVPAVAEALTLWRRGLIPDGLFLHALRKAGLDSRYVDPLVKNKTAEPLDPAVIATAIQRGIMSDPGYLPVGPPTATGKVAAFPVSPLPTLVEAEQSGIDTKRLFVETAIVGLPAPPDLAARMTFRQIIDRVDFDRAIAEGNTRNEWADFLFDGFREILTANQYAELQLRGFLTETQRRAGTDKHGMSAADSDLLYDVLGRSIPAHQITTGLARGGKWTGAATTAPEPYLSSLRRGNLRPEYYSLAYANRYSYPSAFVVRALLTDGALTKAEGEQIFLDVGWKPDLAAKVAAHYAPTGAAVADKHIVKAETQLWTTAHRSYVAEESDDAAATAALTQAGVAAAAIPAVLALWGAERALIRKQLTPTQIRKAVSGAVLNPATGAAWTLADAMAALLARGYDQADAATFLAE